MTDAVKAPHKIEVPGRSAEFAVGNDVVTFCLLSFDQLADGAVLRLFQLFSGDCARLKTGAGITKLLRTKEAADIIKTERNVFIHGKSPSL